MAADASRDVQDEYLEWSVIRDDENRIISVTFTCEGPEVCGAPFVTNDPTAPLTPESSTGNSLALRKEILWYQTSTNSTPLSSTG